MGVIPWSPLAGGWLSGRWRKGAEPPRSGRPAREPERYDLSRPANQRKLEAADGLARLAEEADMSLVNLAIAFVIRHPAVTAAIIGPRTMEQLESQLGAAEISLDDGLLDRIDEIVPPGTQRRPRRHRLAGEPGTTAFGSPRLAPERVQNATCRRRARSGLP
jgi:aryl-alcohol dehydrogenase-like predicted oxidoreductase